MKQPTREQIVLIKEILTKSITQLVTNDSDIFNLEISMPQQISDDAKILNRKLHETTINHRLAFYLEQNIQETVLNVYNVDIEYNRYYKNLKLLNTVEGLLSVRPDILMHTRMNNQVAQQHYLIIEAKKDIIIQHDINKINGFISDSNYSYLFGLSISYCSSSTHILANLYYYDGIEIINEVINIAKLKE